MNPYIYVIFTVLLWGVAPIMDKLALKSTDLFWGMWARSTTIFIFMSVIFILGRRYNILFHNFSPKGLFLFSLSGIVAGLLGMFSYYSALKVLPSSKVVPLCSTYPLVAALLSVLILKEELTLLRFLGIILIILGIWLVK